MKTQTYRVIGLMSGTSLDGLDIAHCTLSYDEDGRWRYAIHQAETIAYDGVMCGLLASATELSGLELMRLHVKLGMLHGKWVADFIKKHELTAEFIASHGHTIFHRPQESLTLQIGSAPHIAAATLLPVVSDFRTLDVACHGQGAPLVPIGDALLFRGYDACLNLGGIANITVQKSETRAFDICICNMALNHLAGLTGRDFDDGGMLARSGTVIPSLLALLNDHTYYKTTGPKSLGKEFFVAEFLPHITNSPFATNDLLATVTEYVATQIAEVIKQSEAKHVLVSGGGAFNQFLIERIRSLSQSEIIIPEKSLIQFKEALVFALLGALRWREEPNCLRAVTGAYKAVCGGSIYLPPPA